MKRIYAIFLLAGIPLLMLAQNPRFAPGYPEKAWLNTPIGLGKTEVYDGIIQADDKILICGSIRREAGVNNPAMFRYSDRNYLVARHLPNGSLDSSFADNGMLSLDKNAGEEFFYDIKLDAAAHIYLLGKGNGNTFVAKLLPDGTPDQQFGIAGFIQIFSRNEEGEIRNMMITPEGKIVFCGKKTGDFLLGQYLPDGSIDEGFGEMGSTQFSLANSGLEDDGIALAMQQNGRILLGGASDTMPVVLGFTAEGKLDLSFNQKGYTEIQSPDYQGRFEQFHVFDDQSFIAVGSENGGDRKAIFAAFQPDGQPDSTRFGTPLIKPNTLQERNFRSMAVSADEEIFYQSFFDKKFMLTKLTSRGKLDTTFGAAGQVIFTLDDEACFASNVMLQASGKIIMTGMCAPAYSLVCLDSAGELDPSFQQKGYLNQKIENGGATIWHLHNMQDQSLIGLGHSHRWMPGRNINPGDVVTDGYLWKFDPEGELEDHFALPFDPDGRVISDIKDAGDGDFIIAGQSFNLTNTVNRKPFIIKMSPSGKLDSTFGDQGTVVLETNNPSDSLIKIFGIEVQQDGKIWVVFKIIEKFTGTGPQGPILVTRLLPDGEIDPDFSGGKYKAILEHSSAYEVTETILDTDGELLIGGFAPKSSTNEVPGFIILKIYESGEIKGDGKGISDPGFMSGGKFVQKPNGELIQAGTVKGDFYLLEYQAGISINSINPAFGFPTLSYEGGAIILSDMALAPNGDILLLGYVDNWSKGIYEGIIACFDAFGRPREAFGEKGIFTFDLGTSYNYPEAISVDADGNFAIGGTAGGEAFLMRFLSDLHGADSMGLSSNFVNKPIIYPNPVDNQIANIRYTLDADQHVRIRLLDMQGKPFITLFEAFQMAGTYSRRLIFRDQRPSDWTLVPRLSPGFYIVQVQTGELSTYIKVQVLPY